MSILTNIKGKLTIKNARAQIAKEFGYSDYNSLIIMTLIANSWTDVA